jgi:hypothetical protein
MALLQTFRCTPKNGVCYDNSKEQQWDTRLLEFDTPFIKEINVLLDNNKLIIKIVGYYNDRIMRWSELYTNDNLNGYAVTELYNTITDINNDFNCKLYDDRLTLHYVNKFTIGVGIK